MQSDGKSGGEGPIPYRSLLNEWQALTREGNDLAQDIRALLQPIFTRSYNRGISVRELSHMIVSEATLLEAETLLVENSKRRAKPTKKLSGSES